MKKDVGSVLQKLIKEQPATKHHLTSLGVPLVKQDDGHFLIDVTDVKVFAGLSTFVRLLTNDVIEQCSFGTADIMVRRKIDAHLTPELAALGLDWVMVYARTDAAENLLWYHKRLGHHMNIVFSAIQTKQWGGLLFGEFFGEVENEKTHTPPALLFPFHLHSEDMENEHFFLLEYSKTGHFLRVTIEDAAASRLQLKHIRHRVVDNLDQQSYLPDIQRIAGQIHQGILRECQNFRAEYKEIPRRQSDLFQHLRQGGIIELSVILFKWPTEDAVMLLPELYNEYLTLLNKGLLLVEDPDVLTVLAAGHSVKMIAGSHRVFYDVSRRGACLNISFDEQRALFVLDHYLKKMPSLRESCLSRKGSLENVRVFLIHHITAEVLGLIRAFQETGCSSIRTFFVKYAGIVPDEYLETLLSSPEETFCFYGLQEIASRHSIRGSYLLSRQYSWTEELKPLDQVLQEKQLDFLDSMRLAAGHLFFKEAIQCRKERGTLLLVEDGGYLAPLINRFCLENRSVGEVFRYFRLLDSPESNNRFGIPPEEMKTPLSEWLAGVFAGSVEHTKNGFDYNYEVMEEFGRLQFPVCSIAVSELKRGPEARECSTSIINAVESILHRLGLMLSQRRVLVLGSSGAIASCTMTDLSHRIGPENVYGVDIAASGKHENGCIEVKTLDELPRENILDTDLVIGLIGKSIIKQYLLEDIVLHGRRQNLFFASGSTKTVEFKDLENWLHKLSTADHPEIAGEPVRITRLPVRDLQTGVLQGHRVSIAFENTSIPAKNLYLLGGLTPINFLYYGIPREIIDGVMSQLLRVSIGMINHYRSGHPLAARLLAVDHQINVDADPLSA